MIRNAAIGPSGRKTAWAAVVLGFGLAVGQSAEAADLPPSAAGHSDPKVESLPAVDGLNASISVFGGNGESGGLAAAMGSVALPIGSAFGTQTDGIVANLNDSLFYSIGQHLFWRDPSIGLLGLYGAYEHYDAVNGVNAGKVGAEAEIYLGRITVRGVAGVEFGDQSTVKSGATTTTLDIKTNVFDSADLVYYPTDDLSLYAGHRLSGRNNALALGGEYLFASSGSMAFSSFAEGQVGEDDASVYGGLKIRFGGSPKSLIRRDREDDPRNWQPDTALGIAGMKAESVIFDE